VSYVWSLFYGETGMVVHEVATKTGVLARVLLDRDNTFTDRPFAHLERIDDR
jgi:hypothetical protein